MYGEAISKRNRLLLQGGKGSFQTIDVADIVRISYMLIIRKITQLILLYKHILINIIFFSWIFLILTIKYSQSSNHLSALQLKSELGILTSAQ